MIGIADLAAILTVVGVSIYVLGLIGLAVTIRLRLASNISIAWYAVSLLPKTVVAGHGVRIWLTWPIVLTLVLLPAAYWAGTRTAKVRSELPTLLLIIAILIVVGMTSLVILFRIVRREGGFVLPSLLRLEGQSIFLPGTLAKLIGNVIMITIGSFMMIVAAAFISDAIIGAEIMSTANRQIVVGITLLFGGGFFVGVPIALTVEPPLPHVEVTKKNSQGAARGRLVNHSEGFWHLFVWPNSDKALVLHDLSHELWSIPDAEVLAVRTVGKLDRASAEVRPTD